MFEMLTQPVGASQSIICRESEWPEGIPPDASDAGSGRVAVEKDLKNRNAPGRAQAHYPIP